MEKRLDRLVKEIMAGCSSADGILPVFVDTGALIDLEKEAKMWSRKDQKYDIEFIYRYLKGHFPLYMTGQHLGEVERHHREHFVCNGNGGVKPEVSSDCFDVARKMNEDYVSFLRNSKGHRRTFDDVAYDVWCAGRHAFPDGHKKCSSDVISDADMELIGTAAWTTLCEDAYGYPVSRVAILSPDGHVAKTVSILTNKSIEFNDRLAYLAVRDESSVDEAHRLSDRQKEILAEVSLSGFGYNGVSVFSTRKGLCGG